MMKLELLLSQGCLFSYVQILFSQQHILGHIHSYFNFVLSNYCYYVLLLSVLHKGGFPRMCPNMQKIFENLFVVELSTQSDMQEWLK